MNENVRELLKYKQVFAFGFQTNSIIRMTSKVKNENKINEEIYSLTKYMRG